MLGRLPEGHLDGDDLAAQPRSARRPARRSATEELRREGLRDLAPQRNARPLDDDAYGAWPDAVLPTGWRPGRRRLTVAGPGWSLGGMATWADVSAACLALPEVVETTSGQERRQWRVRNKAFAWERPLRSRDLEDLGTAAPTGPVLAVSVPDEGAKRALVAAEPDVYLTTHHFDGYAAVLVRLDELAPDAVAELVGEAWACRAPKRLLARHPVGPPPA